MLKLLVCVTVLVSITAGQQFNCGHADILLAIDRSGSVCDVDENYVFPDTQCSNWDKIMTFVRNVVARVQQNAVSSRFSLITFGNEAELHVDFKEFELISGAAGSWNVDVPYVPGEFTNIAAALRMMRSLLSNIVYGTRPGAQPICIIITDGKASLEEDATEPAMLELHKMCTTFAIGVGDEADVDLLKQLSYPGPFNYFLESSFAELADDVTTTMNTICNAAPLLANDCGKSDIIILLDRSGSVCNDEDVEDCDNWRLTKFAGSILITEMSKVMVDPQFAVIVFGNSATTVMDLGPYTGATTTTINSILYVKFENTNMDDAFDKAMSVINGGRGGKATVVMVTDGAPTNPATTIAKAKLLQAKADVIVIGVDADMDATNEGYMAQIASSPHRVNVNYHITPRFEDMLAIVDSISTQACALAPLQECDNGADIVFLLDVSGSICDKCSDGFQFNTDTTCSCFADMMAVVSQFIASTTGNRYSVVTFGNQAEIKFYFNTHSTTQATKIDVEAIEYTAGQNTRMSDALQTVMDNVLPDARTDRTPICFIITDGKPSTEVYDDTITYANELHTKCRTLALGISQNTDVDPEFLKELASGDVENQDFFLYPTFTDMFDRVDLIRSEACAVQPET